MSDSTHRHNAGDDRSNAAGRLALDSVAADGFDSLKLDGRLRFLMIDATAAEACTWFGEVVVDTVSDDMSSVSQAKCVLSPYRTH